MTIESGTSIGDLDPSKPGPSDPKSEGDDHLRLIKSLLKASFPNIKGPMPIAHDQVASKTDIANAQFAAALPGQPGSASPYVLISVNGAASWTLRYPSMTGAAGYFFTNDGTSTSWSNALKANVIRFADGTDATKLAAFDLSGLTTGTTRTYTLPNRNDTLAGLGDISAANGSSMTLLTLATISSAVSNIDFLTSFATGYDRYVIDIPWLALSSNVAPALQFAKAGVVDAGANLYGPGVASGSATTVTSTSSALATAGVLHTLTVEIRNANDAVNPKGIATRGITKSTSSGTQYFANALEGIYVGANVVTGFRLTAGGSTFTGGTIRVYGIKNS